MRVMSRGELFRDDAQFGAHEFEPFALESGDNFAGERAFERVRLEEYEGGFQFVVFFFLSVHAFSP